MKRRKTTAMAKNGITRRTALRAVGGIAAIPIASAVIAGRLDTSGATMRPAMRGIFSSAGDQRAALQSFIDEAAAAGKVIEWGPIDLMLDVTAKAGNRRGLVVPSGSRWVMHPETRFRALPNGSDHYEILNIWNAREITIDGAGGRLIGERNAHRGSTGEWGVGVSIRGSTGIRISNLIVEDCWGDGFYIGSTTEQNYSQDVVLRNTGAIRSRRNGLSLVSARGFLSEDHQSIDTHGTAPEAGVDIEPNDPREYLEDVTFVRTVTRDSAKIGFGIFLGACEGSPNPVGIRLVDCADTGSAVGFSVASAVDLAGRIDLVRPRSNRAGETGISMRRKAVSGPHVHIDQPVITDWNRNRVSVVASQAAITLFASARDKGIEPLGNVAIVAPDIRLTDPQTRSRAAIFVKDQRPTHPERPRDVRITDPVSLASLPVWLTAEHAEFRDGNRVSAGMLPDSDFLIDTPRTHVHNVISTTASRLYTLSKTIPVGAELVFEVSDSRGAGRIRLPDGESLYLDGVEKGTGIWSRDNGSVLRIEKTAIDRWMVVDKRGAWHAVK